MNKVFWVKEKNQPNPKRGYIERIETSAGVVAEFDVKADRIDLDVLKPHIGEKVELYRNGKLSSSTKIVDIGLNEDGVNTLHIETMDEEKVKDENEI